MSSSDSCLRKINSACKEAGFNIDEKFRVRNISCAVNGDINKFKIAIKENIDLR